MQKVIAAYLFIFLGLYACKKNQLGGSSTIKGTVSHHAKLVPNAAVFIKFNTNNFPGSDTNKYDSKVRADAQGNFSIKVYRGDYYLFGYGFDYSILSPYDVIGGTPVRIGNNQDMTVNVAVTEK
jgi:hypothetical protein